MKKFLSLFCALSIILSASALPVQKSLKAQSVLQKARQEQSKKVQKSVAMTKVQKQAAFKMGAKPAAASKKAPKAMQEAMDITIGSVDFQYFESDGDAYYALYSEDNLYRFNFDIYPAQGLTDVELGKTYTLEDMDDSYSLGKSGNNYIYYQSATFTKTLVDKLVKIEATVVDTAGQVYNLLYQETPFVLSGDTVKHSFANTVKMVYSAYYKDWTVTVDDGEFAFKLDMFSENANSAVGSYDSENGDFDLDYTYAEVYLTEDSSVVYAAHSAKAVVAAGDGQETLQVEIIGQNGVVYLFDAFYVAPKAEKQETVTATNLAVNDAYISWFGVVIATASDENYDIYLSLSPETEDYAGEYVIGDYASGDITPKGQEVDNDIFSGSVKLAKAADGTYVLTGKVLCYNNTEYTLNLSYVKPTAKRQYTITANNAVLADLGSAWQLAAVADDEQSYITLAAYYDDQVAGDYAAADFVANYSYAGLFQNGDTAWYDLVDAQIKVEVNEATESAKITGTFLGQNDSDADDVVEFVITAYAVIKQSSGSSDYQYDEDADLIHTFTSYELDDQYLEEYGSVYVEAQDEENYYVILDITLPDGATELVAGEYPIEEEYLPQSVYSGYYSSDYGFIPSFAATLIEEEGKWYYNQIWWIVEGTVTVDQNQNLFVDAVNSLGKVVKLNIYVDGQQGVENVNAKAAALKRVVNGNLIIEKNGVKYNAIGTILK